MKERIEELTEEADENMNEDFFGRSPSYHIAKALRTLAKEVYEDAARTVATITPPGTHMYTKNWRKEMAKVFRTKLKDLES